MSTYDAVVVGARCAGTVAAGKLSRQGWKVLMIDKDRFPSDTISTHFMFPNTVARFDELGILERLQTSHQVPLLSQRWRILGYELRREFSPIQGFTKGLSVRRTTLDSVMIDWARELGVKTHFGARVTDLIGSGQDADPVRGVVLEGGQKISARWVIGADGRASTIASLLGLEKDKPMSGDMAYLFAYWRGLPERDLGSLDIHSDRSALMWNPCEDGIHLLSLAGPPELTRGTSQERMRAYATGIRNYPEVIGPSTLDAAERISGLVVAPESLMRGFYRRSNGPGWALVGDAGHFKHPGTAQGISDAIEQSLYVSGALQGEDPELEGFSTWRRDRTKGHYEWSFRFGTWPNEEIAHPYLRGLSSDSAATQDWFDVLTRLKRPSDVETTERLGAWFGSG